MNHQSTPVETVAIVGNAPEIGDHSAEIDACQRVVRFNNAAGFGDKAGKRVTDLALVNRGGQPREWVERDRLRGLVALSDAREVIFPFPALLDGPAGVCWTREMTLALAPFSLRPRLLDEALHRDARMTLRDFGAMGRLDPSSGFLVTFDLLRRMPHARVRAFGFGFAGWPGHPWAAERRWFEQQHLRGRLDLVPLATSAASSD
ncbi:hypothetical protein [Aureimonas mangrovi]|uniref:hypothetical protein n=1 Tax=Aureimonas mangrovi TaxID=2758041 RepID=UPI001FE8E054|nr:hypothetical protein [Aureimonas mangrovi]